MRFSSRSLIWVGALTVASACSDSTAADETSAPVLPVTPDVQNLSSMLVDGVREFRVRAHVFTQEIETFPYQTAEVWGYNGSTPGPTAIAYEGERIRFIVQNDLPEPTTVHFHGMHAPNDNDGVAGISQQPIPPGGSFTYEFTPGHTGSFAYHAHTSDAKQELKGLEGFFIILPREVSRSERYDRDYVFTLQSFHLTGEGQPVEPFPPGGEFNTHVMNGKTRDAASEMPAEVGERIRIRFYNASQLQHAMHEHGTDITVVDQNGHARPDAARFKVTTVDVGPGNFFDVEVVFEKPGKWTFHCHFPHHTSNSMMDGPNGSPVGMARVFDVSP